MRRLLLILIAVLALLIPATAAQAHPSGTSGVLVKTTEHGAELTLQLQLDQFNKATGMNLTATKRIPVEEIDQLVMESVQLYDQSGDYATSITDTGIKKVNNVDALVVTLDAVAPREAGPFTLNYSLLTHQLTDHLVYVSRIEDGRETDLLGVISANQPSLTIDESAPKAGVATMIGQGMHHIADGYDHLLFLAVLLLSAPLLATSTPAGRRWSPRADGLKSSMKRILSIVTAFTVGHSITLLVVSLGWINPPVQYIETIVALSIAVAAWNLVLPIFTNGEVLLAGIFGLVHGMAFATTILELNLNTADTLLAVIGFNIGIELAQLIGVAVTVPLIHIAATGNYYRQLRVAVAGFAIVASLAWVAGIWTDSDSVLTPMFDAVAAHPLLSYLVFAAAMLLLGLAGPKSGIKAGTPSRAKATV